MAAIGLVLFGRFFHFAILDPTNVGWVLRRSSDISADLLGWQAFRQSPWALPPAHAALLSWPVGTSLLYSDSIPLLSLPLKLLSPVLPADVQLLGCWYLGDIFLMLWFGWRLLRPHTPHAAPALAGACAFALVPAFYDGQDHVALTSHWVILWAFWIVLEARPARRTALFGALLVVSALLHPYLLLMTGTIWGMDWLRRLAGAHSPAARWRGFAGEALVVVLPALAAIWAAGFQIDANLTSGGFGWTAAGLDAFVNPMKDGYSAFLPSRAVSDGQWFEGFHYLGLGLLLLVAVAALLLVRRRPFAQRDAGLWGLGASAAVMALVAISNVVHWDQHILFVVPLPDALLDRLGIVRASGRFLWPLTYWLLLVSLRTILALGPRRATTLLLVLIGVQLADLRPMGWKIRSATAMAGDRRLFALTPSPLWTGITAPARAVVFWPDMWADMPRYYEIAWRAASLRVPVAPAYLGRDPPPAQLAFQQAGERRFAQGQVDPHRLTVALDPCQVPTSLAGTAKRLDGVVVFPPESSGIALPPASLPPALDEGRWIGLGRAGEPSCLRAPDGWQGRTAFIESTADKALLTLRFARPSGGYAIDLVASAPLPGQIVDVTIGETRVARLRLSRSPGLYTVSVGRALADRRFVQQIGFVVKDAPSESQVDIERQTADARIRLFALRLHEASPPAAPGRG